MNSYMYIITGMASSFILCLAMLLFYLKYRKNIMQEQYRRQLSEVKHQKALIHAMITSQEEERKRIGMDLHDEIGAALSAVKLMMQLDNDPLEDTNQVPTGVDISAEMDNIIESVRSISHNLYPMLKGDFGFSDALHEYCDKLNRAADLCLILDFQDEKAETYLRGSYALNMYRVVTELINNTIKHAGAATIRISFYFLDDKYMMDYKDDGIGISPQKLEGNKGMGFKNLESRLGILEAAWELIPVNKGSFIQVSIPNLSRI